MTGLPTGSVTFLFTDIEGSTRLLQELGAEGYATALAQHRRVIREACLQRGGVEVDTQGDAFFVAFASAAEGIAAARAVQQALGDGPVRVRMGLHTGLPHLTSEGYVGEDVHLGARIASAGHGGQVLLSAATRAHADDDVSDLGEHRLKDFDEPVEIFQLGVQQFPPLKTISNSNLPRPASSFLGRDLEITELRTRLRGGTRLVTLTGPGGSGKTRLAIEVATELIPAFKAGVFWVPLAAVRDPAIVAETIAQTLGARRALAEHIEARELLLVLDNLEQVSDAAPSLASLVEHCPNLHLLITSRELLRVPGEFEYQVQPLNLQTAVDLFCARSGLAGDATSAELCRRLDNLPLAIELAAARTTVMSPMQILNRLGRRLDLLKGGRGGEPRQQTLRATIEWSYALLKDDERRLFAGLAAFRGGCTLESAEAVVDADLDVLQSLVDKSLLRHTGERFWMLETIREFASEHSDEPMLLERHAQHYLQLAEDGYLRLMAEPKSWLERLEAEHDNLRAALDYFEESQEWDRAAALAGAVHRFWKMHGHIREGSERIERLLAIDAPATSARARLLDGASALAFDRADYPAARARAEQALTLHETLHEAWGATYSTMLIANAASESGDFATGSQLAERCALRFRELGDDYYARIAYGNLGYFLQELGELDRAREVLEHIAADARGADDERSVAHSLGQLGQVAILQRRYDDAVDPLVDSLRIWDSLGDRAMSARELRRLARVMAQAQRPEQATRLLASSEAMRTGAGQSEGWIEQVNQVILDLVRPELDDETFARAWAEGSKYSAQDAIDVVSDTLG